MGWTPCDFRDETMPIGQQYRCPYSDDPTSEMCRNCIAESEESEDEYPID